MKDTIKINTETFDFDFWTNNKVNIIRILANKGGVEDIRTLSLLARLSYATTHDIFTQLARSGYVKRNGRQLELAENWEETFQKGLSIALDDKI